MTDQTRFPPTKVDSAMRELVRVDELNALAEQSADRSPRSAIGQAEAARELAATLGYRSGHAAALATLSRLHQVLGEYGPAQELSLSALDLYRELEDRSGEVAMLVLLGRGELIRANHAVGFQHLFEALQLAQSIGDRAAETSALYGLFNGYILIDDIQRALETVERALAVDRELGNARGEARDLNGLAVAQHQLGRFDEALASARESHLLSQQGGFRLTENLALSTLCEAYEQLGDYEGAIDYCGRCLDLGRELGFDIPTLTALIRLGGVYRKAGQIDESIAHYLATMELAERTENRKDVMTCHRELSELYELKGDLPSALVHQRRYSEVREAIVNAERDQKIQALEVRHRTETAHREAEIYQLRNVALEQEIADRKRAEDELRTYKEHLEDQVAQRTAQLTEANARLRASEERYRALYEDTPSMYFTIDPAGIVQSVNTFGAEQLGYTPDELLGDSVLKVFVDEDRSSAAGHVAECLANPDQVFHWELRKIRKDGSRLTVRETARAAIDPDGKPVVLIVCEDITEKKRAEEAQARLEAELRQAQKMEAIGRLAGGVAHDFNNLLTAMTGYLELVLAGLDADSPLRQDAEEARRAAERAATVTNQLLAFSRRQPVAPGQVSLNEIVGEMQRLLKRLIGEDIELVTRLQPEVPPVWADRGQLEQVIVNLAVNARDAMPDGGILTIETANADDGEAPSGGDAGSFVRLSVSDTGTGMDEATRVHIFEPFFTTKEHGKGTGLGLSTVFGIVEQHHGWVTVGSGPDGGTTFRIWLPGAVARAVSAKPTPIPDDAGGSETVLLVEDEELIRSLAARVLRDRGYVVLEAQNADEGLSLAAQRGSEIDLALSDVVMPGLSGHEFGRLLRERNPGVPVVLMSGYDMVMAEGKRQLDADTVFLSKPFTPATLLRTVRRALDAVRD